MVEVQEDSKFRDAEATNEVEEVVFGTSSHSVSLAENATVPLQSLSPQVSDAIDLEPIGKVQTGSSGKAISASSLTTTSSERKTVHPRRKEELLLEARAERRKWIQQVPLPYRKRPDLNDPWSQDERLSSFQSSHAAAEVPSALPLLVHLYGTSEPEQIGAHIESLVSEQGKALPTGDQILLSEIQANEDDNTVLKAYHQFLTLLYQPDCAMLVQGMRRFCHNLQNFRDNEAIGSQLRAFIDSTLAALQCHATAKCKEHLRRSLESFVFGQCYSHIEAVLWNSQAETREKEWLDRLASLQFVNPTHLEIACLQDFDNYAQLLRTPVEALLSVDIYYSPYEKLERILAMYRAVNACLQEALNRDATTSYKKKLPSADDVLPTIILVLLKAQPTRLLTNLQIIEEWSPPEYVRGEAGYAYTNLYGAVRFLQELDLNEPRSLSISPAEFRQGLETCRAAADERLHLPNAATAKPSELHSELEPKIPVLEVRSARTQGETLDISWAQRISGEQSQSVGSGKAPEGSRRSAFDEAMAGLPEDFSRNYTFLTACPEDIKMSDLPLLLSEYRTLVHTTERLIGDKAYRILASRKAEAAAVEKDLFARVREVDPSLLPTNGSKLQQKNDL